MTQLTRLTQLTQLTSTGSTGSRDLAWPPGQVDHCDHYHCYYYASTGSIGVNWVRRFSVPSWSIRPPRLLLLLLRVNWVKWVHWVNWGQLGQLDQLGDLDQLGSTNWGQLGPLLLLGCCLNWIKKDHQSTSTWDSWCGVWFLYVRLCFHNSLLLFMRLFSTEVLMEAVSQLAQEKSSTNLSTGHLALSLVSHG